MFKKFLVAFVLLIAVSSISLASNEAAPPVPSPANSLMLPYFKVGINTKKSAVFSVVNGTLSDTGFFLTVYSNWSVSTITTHVNITGSGVRTIDLRDWFVNGNPPDGTTLSPSEVLAFQTQLSSMLSLGNVFYSGKDQDGYMTGFVLIRPEFGHEGYDIFWGDYFYTDDDGNKTEGDRLVRLYPQSCGELCTSREMRFTQTFDGSYSTKALIWYWNFTPGLPSGTSNDVSKLQTLLVTVKDDKGNLIHSDAIPDTIQVWFAQSFSIADLNLPVESGTIHFQIPDNYPPNFLLYIEEESFTPHGSSILPSWCPILPPPTIPPPPPEETPTPTPRNTPPTATPTRTHTPTDPPVKTPTATQTPTRTFTVPPTPTWTPTRTPTKPTCPTKTPCFTKNPTATRTPTKEQPTCTPKATATPTPTHKPTSCPPKPTATPTNTRPPNPTATPTPSHKPTSYPPKPTATATPTHKHHG